MQDPAQQYDEARQLARDGKAQAAIEALAKLLETNPDNTPAWALMGRQFMQLNAFAAALPCFDRVIAAAPTDAGIHIDRGNALYRSGQTLEAVEAYDRGLAIDPNLAHAQSNKARLLIELHRPREALAAANAALARNDGLVQAWRHRGYAEYCLDLLPQALESYDAALARASGELRADILSDMARPMLCMGRHQEVIGLLDESLAAHPLDNQARFRRGEARLAMHDFAGGWDDYEARWLLSNFSALPVQTLEHLRGILVRDPTPDDLRGQRVLVVREQGVGDEIMFAGILPDLRAIAASVTVLCEQRLARILSHSMPGIEVIPQAGEVKIDLGRFDRVVGIGSLGAAFRRDLAAFSGEPYLRPTPEAAERWWTRLGPKRARLRIGLSWTGGGARTRRAARSIPLETLMPLLTRSDCEFVSLQYGDVEAELARTDAVLARPITRFPAAELNDFDDLAGLTQAMDVVVTVQTALCHLAGAIGRPGLVMIPIGAEWRYGAEGDRMPWYRSLGLLRQTSDGGWPEVIARVGQKLDALPPD